MTKLFLLVYGNKKGDSSLLFNQVGRDISPPVSNVVYGGFVPQVKGSTVCNCEMFDCDRLAVKVCDLVEWSAARRVCDNGVP